jgi:F-type H+-transporting ATPase subunit a
MNFGHPEPTWLHPLAKLIPESLLPYAEFVVITVLVALILIGTFGMLARRLSTRDVNQGQAFSELVVNGFVGFVGSVLGPHSERLVPLIGTLFLFILTMNLFGLIPGMLSPTASMNTTVALALIVFFRVQYEGIRSHGFLAYLKHFAGEPTGIHWIFDVFLGLFMFPLHLIGELAKPLSLCLRLAGNIFAEDSVIFIFGTLSPVLYLFLKYTWAKEVPFFPLQILILPLMILFGVIQALVFSLLTSIYIAVMVGESHEEAPAH